MGEILAGKLADGSPVVRGDGDAMVGGGFVVDPREKRVGEREVIKLVIFKGRETSYL